MSLSLLDRTRPAAAPAPAPRRRWFPTAREPVLTLFLQEHAAWGYAPGDQTARRYASSDAWLLDHAGCRLRLVLSTALTHQLVVNDPALPLEDMEALLAWARHQFVHYHGAAAQHWPVSAWLNGEQRGASAVHGIDLDALVRRAGASGVQVRSVQPWWAVALQAATLQAPTLALAEAAELWIVEGARVTRVRCGRGRVRQIEQHWLVQPEPAELATLIAGAGVPAQSCWLLGYGLRPGDVDVHGVRVLGALHEEHPAPHWLGA
ncbi:hypothetical protein [Variovorax sp. YR752]|uniref:hypothetical protein n=1 Tax=Variovorax sp. YR752 TaxID=1884383 RepID=UPI003137B231